ncbi:hypothetical protein Ciccas_005527 [Cichlidogyrus casuarinus]|uniref:Uncharacterized protein n=1 Tax=Cichlidogyrus casuarinus TaxID=1844966 RepID=A0ABD2QC12_9PLAT
MFTIAQLLDSLGLSLSDLAYSSDMPVDLILREFSSWPAHSAESSITSSASYKSSLARNIYGEEDTAETKSQISASTVTSKKLRFLGYPAERIKVCHCT